MARIRRWAERIDAWQQSRSWVAFPFAVAKKFSEDRGGSLAALVAYFGFFSLFPLLLVLVTAVGFAVRNDPSLQQRIIESALGQFPVVGTQIGRNVRALQGSVPLLAFGLVTALWSGMAVASAFHDAMDAVWDVPKRDRGGFGRRRLRQLAALVVVGLTLPASALLSGLGTSGRFEVLLRAGAFLGAVVVEVGVFAMGFRLLTAADVTWRQVAPGAILAGVTWVLLQSAGTYLVDRQIRGASDVYGFFAVVLGLLWWIYVGAQVALFAAEVNVVMARHLWPRRLVAPPTAPADRRSLSRQANETAAVEGQRVEVKFGDAGVGEPPPG
ncbi:MAG TPA: YihY/virulence factor BrkB family protein [Actinomycetota bacterium]|nr:YihY/virulence factor BrkB family protein [Actinomycetota bacterium]